MASETNLVMFYIAVILAVITDLTSGHVSLTFPPARKYGLDFLDNVRTEQPCGGMPKGDLITSIPNGQKTRIDWHLGYFHDGGFKIELLSKSGRSLKDFTNGFNSNSKTAVSYEIDIASDVTCEGCILKLTRQAGEWGSSYQFMSCADVDIVAAANYQTDCSGFGTPDGSSCDCDRKHFGDRCQFDNDCLDDSDCTNKGRCITNPGTALPRNECYCQLGYFGRQCQKTSVINSKNYNITNYIVRKIRGDDFQFLWRFLGTEQSEMEGIIIAKTTSYASVGWRSKNASPQCQKFPTDVQSPFIPKSLHKMDCQDIIIGRATGSWSNIGDYYTRDRSTPRRDEFYGGKEDLTAAAGWEEDGVTTIMFRKPVKSDSPTDNEFVDMLEFIYAFGQNGQDFYKDDEIKYHGGNRGHIVLQGKLSSGNSVVVPFAPLTICLFSILYTYYTNL